MNFVETIAALFDLGLFSVGQTQGHSLLVVSSNSLTPSSLLLAFLAKVARENYSTEIVDPVLTQLSASTIQND